VRCRWQRYEVFAFGSFDSARRRVTEKSRLYRHLDLFFHVVLSFESPDIQSIDVILVVVVKEENISEEIALHVLVLDGPTNVASDTAVLTCDRVPFRHPSGIGFRYYVLERSNLCCKAQQLLALSFYLA
jgi:hypothetical protein